MSEYVRFLITVDASNGVPAKAEKMGDSGDLEEVDLALLLAALARGRGGREASTQITVNIYSGGSHDKEESQVTTSDKARNDITFFPPWPPIMNATKKE